MSELGVFLIFFLLLLLLLPPLLVVNPPPPPLLLPRARVPVIFAARAQTAAAAGWMDNGPK